MSVAESKSRRDEGSKTGFVYRLVDASARRLLADWWYVVPALVVAAGVVAPLVYLVLRALQAEASELGAIVFRMRNLWLLGNTVGLTAGVLVGSTLIAFPMAWLTARARLRGQRFFTLLGVLPLAVPGYVMAYALLGATGPRGALAEMGWAWPPFSGYTGALLTLTLGLFPYLFLNLRTALAGLDPALEESGRALGLGPWQAFRRITLPQLRPALLAGGLLIGLHVLGDFGVVSLMRFETFSYALYLQYAVSYEGTAAAWLALMLLALTTVVLVVEARLLRGLLYHRAGSGVARRMQRVRIGLWRWPAYVFMGAVGLASVGLPVGTVLFWLGSYAPDWTELASALEASVSASVPAALLAAALALPLTYRSVRRPTVASRLLERGAYFGYALPPLAFALAFIFFSLRAAPGMYQTLALLVVAYALHFLAEAIGPMRSALYQAPPHLEEAARSMGCSRLRAFGEVTFPLLRRGLIVSIAFVFLSAMKELPLTFLLAPPGFETLALGTWSYAREALFGEAAPYALLTMAFSAAFVGVLLVQERD